MKGVPALRTRNLLGVVSRPHLWLDRRSFAQSAQDLRFVLRSLVNVVENLHEPLHVGDNHDRGGNDTQVRFFDRGTNMHSLWDSGMIERVSTRQYKDTHCNVVAPTEFG